VSSELVELPSFSSTTAAVAAASSVSSSAHQEKVASQLLSAALCQPTYINASDDGDIFAYRLCRYRTTTLYILAPARGPWQGKQRGSYISPPNFTLREIFFPSEKLRPKNTKFAAENLSVWSFLGAHIISYV